MWSSRYKCRAAEAQVSVNPREKKLRLLFMLFSLPLPCSVGTVAIYSGPWKGGQRVEFQEMVKVWSLD